MPESWFPIYRNDGLYHRKGGSVLPEWWLSNSGQVAQWEPEYSIGRCQYMALFLWMGIGALMLNKKERDRLRPFIYTLFGTFLILILYEMKARYVLHCLLPMILLAWKGMECTSQKLLVPSVETINIQHNHAEDSILPRLRQCIILLVLAGALCIFTYQTRWQQTYTTSVSAAHDLDLSDVTIDLGLSDNKKYQFMFTAD